MDLTALINCSDTVEDVELIEGFFQLNDSEKNAAFYRKLAILYKGLEEDLSDDNREIHPDLYNGWSAEEREAFERDWQDDSFTAHLPPTPESSVELDWPKSNSVTEQSQLNQLGEEKRKLDHAGETSNRLKLDEYFIIRTGKQINVRKFKTSGMFHGFVF